VYLANLAVLLGSEGGNVPTVTARACVLFALIVTQSADTDTAKSPRRGDYLIRALRSRRMDDDYD